MNALLALMLFGISDTPPSALACTTPIVAKGDIKGGPALSHTFELTNRSTYPITITKVEVGCGCVKRTLSATVLKAGEVAKLTLEVNTLTQPDGANRWQSIVSFTLEDSARSSGELVLAVTANLSRDVTVTPPQIAFSTTGEAAQQLKIADRRGKPLTVVKATSTTPHFAVSLGAAAAGSQSIQVKLVADAPAGQRDEVVVLHTDDPAYPEFRVPVRVNKKSPSQISAAPEELSVKLGPGQEEVSALVQLRAPEGKTIRIEAAESDFAAVSTKFSTQAGPVGTVRITVGGLAASRSGSCKVKIRLAEPAGQDVIVPVSWTSGK